MKIYKTKKFKYTKEKLIQFLIDEYTSTGKIPSSKTIRIPNCKTYVDYFGSWNNALKEAGLNINKIGNYTKDEIVNIILNRYYELGRIPKYKDISCISKGTIRNYVGSIENVLIESGINVKENIMNYKKKQFIYMLNQKSIELGKTPSVNDFIKLKLPYRTIIRVFGSWNNALIESKLK